MTTNNNIILSAQDIVVEFDVRDRVLTAIRGVSLELVEGEVLALVGESGSNQYHWITNYRSHYQTPRKNT